MTPAPALLFFGCDHPGRRLPVPRRARRLGGAGHRRGQARRSPPHPVGDATFVQDRLWADRAEVVALVRQGATFFVCGDGRRMAPAVHDTCVRIYREATGADAERGGGVAGRRCSANTAATSPTCSPSQLCTRRPCRILRGHFSGIGCIKGKCS